MIFVCREEVEVFCHVVWAVARQVSTGEEQAGADTFVAGVWRAAADRRARFPAFPRLPGSSVWRVLQILQVDLTFSFLQKTSKNAVSPSQTCTNITIMTINFVPSKYYQKNKKSNYEPRLLRIM